LRGGGKLLAPEKRLYNNKPNAYTLAEIVVVMLIIAVIVGVSIKVTKSRLDNILSYTYYSTYSTLRSVTANMLADFNPEDEIYKANNKTSLFAKLYNHFLLGNLGANSAYGEGTAKMYGCPYAAYDYFHITYTIGGTPNGGIVTTGGFLLGSNIYEGWTSADLSDVMPCNFPADIGYPEYGGSWVKCPGKRDGEETYAVSEADCKWSCDKYSWVSSSHNQAYFQKTGTCGPIFPLDRYSCITAAGISTGDSETLVNDKYCLYEEDCPEGTYVDSFESDNGLGGKRRVEYCAQAYQCCDGTYVKSLLECDYSKCPSTPSVCNIHPGETETQLKYCSGKKFDDSPEVCDWVNITPWPPSCETGKEWSEEHCKCIAIPASLPKKGVNFCELFESLVNIAPNESVCSGDSIDINTKDFTKKKPDLVLRNGIRLYNVHQNPSSIPQLNIPSSGTSSSELNEQHGYTIYADIDGNKGNSILWDDVYPFYLTLSGKVIPAYDKNVNPEGAGGDSEEHLQVSVKNESFSGGGHRVLRWLSKSVSFKEGACQSGYVNSETPYCSGSTYNLTCNSMNSNCRLKPIRPLKFF